MIDPLKQGWKEQEMWDEETEWGGETVVAEKSRLGIFITTNLKSGFELLHRHNELHRTH